MFWIKVLAPVFRLKTRGSKAEVCALKLIQRDTFNISSRRYLSSQRCSLYPKELVLIIRRDVLAFSVAFYTVQTLFIPIHGWTTFLAMMAAVVPAATSADKQRILSYRLVAEGPFARDNNVQPVEKRQSSLPPPLPSLSCLPVRPLFRRFSVISPPGFPSVSLCLFASLPKSRELSDVVLSRNWLLRRAIAVVAIVGKR